MKPEDIPECSSLLFSLWWLCVHGLVVDCVVCALRVDVASNALFLLFNFAC